MPTDADDAAMEAAENRARALAPKVLDLVLDVLEGRKQLLIETVPDKMGGFVTSFHIADNP